MKWSIYENSGSYFILFPSIVSTFKCDVGKSHISTHSKWKGRENNKTDCMVYSISREGDFQAKYNNNK